jgi:hypothetical protein
MLKAYPTNTQAQHNGSKEAASGSEQAASRASRQQSQGSKKLLCA